MTFEVDVFLSALGNELIAQSPPAAFARFVFPDHHLRIMAPPFLHALRDLAAKDPVKLPASVLLQYSSFSLTVFDLYPKAKFHFLVLPRHTGGETPKHLKDLQSLLASGRKNTLKILQPLNEDALKARETIEEEMVRRYGAKWGINIGFHAVPSMEYVSMATAFRHCRM